MSDYHLIHAQGERIADLEAQIAAYHARFAKHDEELAILKQAFPQLFPQPVRPPAQHRTADQLIDKMFQTSEVAGEMARAVPDDQVRNILHDNGIGRR
jgi:hypothetical protein